jgi:phytoene/squalene synthetase
MTFNKISDKQMYWEIFNAIDFEKIVDHPNILIAAHFWDNERYQAARTCYKFMRAIDDLIDNYKSEHKIIAPELTDEFESNVNNWINNVIHSSTTHSEYQGIIETIRRFSILAWPLETFAKSMIYDIHHDGFATLDTFIDYAGGASVAPASIFVHLCGLTKENNTYLPPAFDVKEVATPCAIFSYLVHIIRDFVKDHTHNLNYFPDDLIDKHKLDRQKLLSMAQGERISDNFRTLIAELYVVADNYRIKTQAIMQEIKPYLEPASQLSIEIIFELYVMVFERIDIDNGTFSTAELNPTPVEIKERVKSCIDQFEPVHQ